jgi:8-oxo-dGTP pyrophosphatase MutT (NUDIX family)
VEEQDHLEHWQEHYPEVFQSPVFIGKKYYDFNARMCAIRETFEETNQLIVRGLDELHTIESIS